MADAHDDMLDPELRRQLDVSAEDASLGAVFTLRSGAEAAFLSPEEARTLAELVVERAASTAHARPEAVQVFANVQSFAVQGPAALVRAIIAQPEVETAVANVQSGDALIGPRNRRDVELQPDPARRGMKRRKG